ncbi:phosphopantetheine-binding protein [Pseudoalteromonas luteoviolacea]|uniref:phosphopantetheine-binding protein n=1 Tax=Pseudoalteromonas luteoviolacea TaxID=43657 RepID=UPI001EED5239|nr:phosphopantetheine-binding protein [Pseudoalteromonas luteoviolacea]MCF6442200.1 phosphopantetheine-binding protein [Pseudoalteromonas luteoviolacea]
MAHAELNLAVKKLIIESLDLEDISPEEIIDDEPLFIDGLGLDSIDALELGLAIKKQYGVKIDANSEGTKQHFASVASLCAFIASHEPA